MTGSRETARKLVMFSKIGMDPLLERVPPSESWVCR